MPLVPVEFASSMLLRFGLHEYADQRHRYSYSDILIGEKSNVLLFKRSHYHCGDWYTDTFLSVNGKNLRVTIQSPPKFKRKKTLTIPASIRLQAYVPLEKSDLSKALRIAKQISPQYFGFPENSEMSFQIVDETKQKKPRSIKKLCHHLNKFSLLIERNSIIHAMSMFVPFVVTVEEAKSLRENIEMTGGKGLTDKSLLIFELGFEKCKDKL